MRTQAVSSAIIARQAETNVLRKLLEMLQNNRKQPRTFGQFPSSVFLQERAYRSAQADRRLMLEPSTEGTSCDAKEKAPRAGALEMPVRGGRGLNRFNAHNTKLCRNGRYDERPGCLPL